MDTTANGNWKDEYFELLRFPSVGADPNRLRDCVACAGWLAAWLERLGFETSRHLPEKTFAPPVLFAERRGDDGAPTVLVYGHYDVQPADPVEAWKTPPFEPTEIDGRVYCRGAQDDKGQTFALLCGVRDFLEATPAAVPTVKVLLEGQEENGSVALSELLASASPLRKLLAADVLLVCDTSAAADLRPAIVAGLRGVSNLTLRLTGPNRDLHSGEYGGIAPNPAMGMARLLASLHTANGAIAVAGFRDGIVPPSAEELRIAESSVPDEAAYRDDIGCEPAGGELGKGLSRRLGFEPTIEVNGIHTGYGGPGGKTVIPAEAVAKLSLRLVPGQSPRTCYAALRTHLEDRVPNGMKLSFEEWSPGATGFRLPLGSPVFALARDVLTAMDPRGPVFHWEGASIPVVSAIREASGAAPLLVGWGQAEDRIHSPNESYSLVQFAKAREWASRILAALAG